MRTRRRVCAWAVALGAAALAVPATGTPATDLLPNLVARPTRALYVGTATDAFVNGNNAVVHGCTPYEVSQDGARRCLRFQTIAVNRGLGPLELRYHYDEAATSHGAYQRVYRSDGSHVDRDAGTYEIEPSHAHIHYAYFAIARLWKSDAKGRRIGKYALRESIKEGFCLIDTENHDEGREPPIPRRYVWPDACYPTMEGTEVSQVNGLSVGWADVYDMGVAHQYVEVSSVPDGYYLLEIAVNPAGKVRETRRNDNTVWQRVRLCGTQAELVGVNYLCDRR